MTTGTGHVTILVVEDNRIDRMMLERNFKSHRLGNPVVYAENGVEALRILRGGGEQSVECPFLVLLDLHMPKMNGIEFLDAVRADPNLARTLVLVLTTSDDQRDVDDAYGRQVAGYLVKQDVVADFTKLVHLVQSLELSIRFPAIDTSAGKPGRRD